MEENKKINEMKMEDNTCICVLALVACKNFKKCNATLYKSFQKLRNDKLLLKEEEAWITYLLDYYDRHAVFPSRESLEANVNIDLSDNNLQAFIEQLSLEQAKNLKNICLLIIDGRKRCMFKKDNKELIEQSIKTGIIPLDLYNNIKEFVFETSNIFAHKCLKPFKFITGIPEIDARYSSLFDGSIIGLIKTRGTNNYIEASTIYNMIMQENHNVCVITSSFDNAEIVAKLLAIHSNSLPEDLRISYWEVINGQGENEKIQKVYDDFMAKAGTHLQIFCNSTLKIFNESSFTNLISIVDETFKETTGKPLTFLVIDTLENFRLENNRQIVDDNKTVLKKYLDIIIKSIKIFSDDREEKMNALISTNYCSNAIQQELKLHEDYRENKYVKFENGSNLLEKYADLVIVASCNFSVYPSKEFTGTIQVIKSTNHTPMDEPREIFINGNTCTVRYGHYSYEDISDYKRTSDIFETQEFFPTFENFKEKYLLSSK